MWLSACWVSKRGETSIASVPMSSPCKAERSRRGLEGMGGLSARIIHHGDTEGTEKNRKDQ